MGTLDEAIREHLELKRQRGAEDSEIQGLESEAFGPADRPDAVEPEPREASAVTTPIEEGDRSEPVFEVNGQSEAKPPAGEPPTAETDATGPPTFAEPAVAADEPAADTSPVSEVDETGGASATGPAAAPEGQAFPAADASPEAGAPAFEPATPEPSAEAESPVEPVAERVPEPSEEKGDASDMLEAERRHMAEHPTEHYDVDAAMAEEDEIDVLSESSLSDELDRALDGPLDPSDTDQSPAAPTGSDEASATEPPFPQPGPPGPDPQPGPPEPVPDPLPPVPGPEPDPEPGPPPEPIPEPVIEEPIPEPVIEEPTPEPDSEEEVVEEEDGTASFFDQDDPLEATPEFLEETPEHDRLWFEQKEPKDFDFGD